MKVKVAVQEALVRTRPDCELRAFKEKRMPVSPAADEAPWTTSANQEHGGESDMSHERQPTGLEHLAHRPGKETPSFVALSFC